MLGHYRHSRTPILMGILFGLIALFLFLKNDVVLGNALQRLEAIPYDLQVKLSIPRKINNTPAIVIIDIDEKSLQAEGRFPWSRRKMAALIDKLYQQGTAVIALDILQSEPETNPAQIVLNASQQAQQELPEWFGSLKTSLDADTILATTIQEKEVVLGYPFHQGEAEKHGRLGASAIVEMSDDVLHSITAIEMKGFTGNLDIFTQHAAGTGFFSIIPDPDGSIRRAPLVAMYNNKLYPSLALEAARLYMMEDEIRIQSKTMGDVQTITEISLGDLNIPTDAHGQLLVPYYGGQRHFTYISATDILHAEESLPILENAVVFVGTSAVGLVDLRPTPVEPNYPGVEVQANILHGILHPDTVAYTPAWKEGAIISEIILLTLIMALLYPLLSPVFLLFMGISLLGVSIALNAWLWFSHHLSLPIVPAILLILSVSGFHVAHYLIRENRDRQRIHGMFGQYVPVDHINKIIENPEDSNIEGERREMSVLFSDIRNFTDLSEPLSTSELKNFLNHYLTPVTRIIFDHSGTIDKYVGDMVMAFWGAPLKSDQHASDSVKAALAIQQAITQMQGDFKNMGLPEVRAGIGIHTGEMNVGDMGSDYRRAYTVLGDAVNLGSRLESLTRFYSVPILVSEATVEQCPDINFRYIDFVQVKGRKDAVKIYEPLAHQEIVDSEWLEKHEEACSYYLSGNWGLAKRLLGELYQQTEEPIYDMYLERIENNAGVVPKGWQGIYTHSRK